MTEANRRRPIHYSIRIKERIDPSWSGWFEGFMVTQMENGETIISGPIADQSALHGLIAKVRDLNLTLISVTRDEGSKTRPAIENES